MQAVKVDPTSLQPASVAPKKEVLLKRQRAKTVLRCVEELNLQPTNSHASKTAPVLVASVRSQSTNRQRAKDRPERSSPYQSSSEKTWSLACVPLRR